MLENSSGYLVNNLILTRVIDSWGSMVSMPAKRLVNCIHMGSLLDCLVSLDYQYEMETSQAISQMHRMLRKVKNWDRLVSFHSLEEEEEENN